MNDFDESSDQYDTKIQRLESRLAKQAECIAVMRAGLEYISQVETTDHGPIDSVDLMSELANERLFDISKARASLAKAEEMLK